MNRQSIDELMDVAATISRGETSAYQHNEGFTSGAFDQLLANVGGPRAFELLNTLCERIAALIGRGADLKGYYFLLSQLALLTNTTQMPQGMQSIIDADPLLSHELRMWYRCER